MKKKDKKLQLLNKIIIEKNNLFDSRNKYIKLINNAKIYF